MNYLTEGFGMTAGLPFMSPTLIIVIMTWSLVWKGISLWHASQRNEKMWFVALLVINTVGILEMIYLFVVAKKTLKDLFGGLRK